ncbi:DUF7837 family putative zinc-binding protein [Natrarchaeobius chitinivorans]
MSANRSTLGTCPRCGASIPSPQLLIEYGTDEGTGIFAECPACREVVAPD